MPKVLLVTRKDNSRTRVELPDDFDMRDVATLQVVEETGSVSDRGYDQRPEPRDEETPDA